jgi:hypothetical protein
MSDIGQGIAHLIGGMMITVIVGAVVVFGAAFALGAWLF